MEDWIGILIVLLMIPGLILLIGVVVVGMVHLKRNAENNITPLEPSSDRPVTPVPTARNDA